jgi:hypothetical protein
VPVGARRAEPGQFPQFFLADHFLIPDVPDLASLHPEAVQAHPARTPRPTRSPPRLNTGWTRIHTTVILPLKSRARNFDPFTLKPVKCAKGPDTPVAKRTN